MAVGEHAISFLPMKFSFHPWFAANKIIAFHLYLLHKIWNVNDRFDAYKQMRMVWHAVHGQHFGFSGLHQSGDIFVQFFFVLFRYKAVPSLDCKHKLKMDL